MTINDLRETVDQLQKELEKVGGSGHVKAASLRVRKILTELKKNATDLKKQLLSLDNER